MGEPLRDLHDSWAPPRANWRSRLVVVAILLAPLIYMGIAVWKGQSRTVHLVNGTNAAYAVEFAGKTLRLPPMSQTPVQVAEGDVIVRVTGGDVPIPDQTIRIQTPFWTRPVMRHTFVVNPDGAGVLLWQEVEYAVNPTGAKDQHEVHAAKVLHAFSRIDYEFEPLPDTVNLGKSSSTMKRLVSQLTWQPADAHEMLVNQLGKETAAEYLMAMARFESQDEHVWSLMSDIEHQKLASFLKPGIEQRPLLVQWHRAYQDMIERHAPEVDLEPVYQRHLEEQPNDPVRIYLAARLYDENPQRQEEAFIRASELGLNFAPPVHWLTYSQFGTARFEQALASSCKLAACDPQNSHYRFHIVESLLALKRIDEALEVNAQMMARAPDDGYVVADQMVLHLLKGEADAAKAVADGFVDQATRQSGPQVGIIWGDILEAYRLYQLGDAKGFGELVPSFQDERWTVAGLISTGRLREAFDALAGIDDAGDGHLVLAVAALAAGDRTLGDQCLEKVAADLQKEGGHVNKRMAEWLLSPSAPNAQEVCDLRTRTPTKLPLLLALGIKHPSIRTPCFDLAEKLDCWPQFPHLIYRQALDSKSNGSL